MLLDPAGTMLRGLNPTAARVWELLDGRQTAAEIASRLTQEFPVPPERALGDVVEFLSGLEARALVEKMDGGMR
ncbi:MAG: PqqD family protein [Myxococcaceae bacterium]